MAPERPSKGFAASKKPPKKPKKRTAAQTQKNNARFINHAIKKHSQSQEKELTATRLAEEGWTSAINNMHLADSIKSDSADQILVDEAWTLTTSAYEPQTAPGYQPPSEPFDEHTPSTPVMSGLDEGCCSPIAPAFSPITPRFEAGGLDFSTGSILASDRPDPGPSPSDQIEQDSEHDDLLENEEMLAMTAQDLTTRSADRTQAPFDLAESDTKWLAQHGYTEAELVLGNSMFEGGSIERIIIESLKAWRPAAEEFIAGFGRVEFTHADKEKLYDCQSCRPRNLVGAAPSYMVPYVFEGVRCYYYLSPSRVLAIFKPVLDGGLGDEELWKAVAPLWKNRTSFTNVVRLFEASGRCNVFQGDNHCIEPSHVSMETKNRNTIRAGHHAGEAGCFCTEECIGPDVKRLQWTSKDAVKFKCRTPGCDSETFAGGLCAPCYATPATSKKPQVCLVEVCLNRVQGKELGEDGLTMIHRQYCVSHKNLCAYPGCKKRCRGAHCSKSHVVKPRRQVGPLGLATWLPLLATPGYPSPSFATPNVATPNAATPGIGLPPGPGLFGVIVPPGYPSRHFATPYVATPSAAAPSTGPRAPPG
jgi:hypothetical protein